MAAAAPVENIGFMNYNWERLEKWIVMANGQRRVFPISDGWVDVYYEPEIHGWQVLHHLERGAREILLEMLSQTLKLATSPNRDTPGYCLAICTKRETIDVVLRQFPQFIERIKALGEERIRHILGNTNLKTIQQRLSKVTTAT